MRDHDGDSGCGHARGKKKNEWSRETFRRYSDQRGQVERRDITYLPHRVVACG